MKPTDYRYPIDQTIYTERLIKKVKEARECVHTAVELRQLGYPAMAAWEDSLKRQCMKEARLIKTLIEDKR
jgi:hypothetical protein